MPSRYGDAGGGRRAPWARIACLAVALSLAAFAARAEEIKHPTAVFAGLDKITGRITSFDVAIDETVQFGTLQITPRVCLTTPPTEKPLTEGFVEVDDVESAQKPKRIFFGWMFAASPGLNGVEHPIYDVWLKDCTGAGKLVNWPVNTPTNVNVGQPAPANAAPAPVEARKPERTITPENPVEPSMESLPPAPEDIEPAPQNGDLEGEPPAASPPPAAPGKPAPGKAKTLGPPIEIGPPPGAEEPSDSQPAPRSRRSRRHRHPAEGGNGAAQTQYGGPQPQYNVPPPTSPRHERLAPMRPQDLPPDSIY